ncbi:MAG: hypothetical protein ACYTDW_09345 [Planctomycetota bacterium]
MRLIRRARGPGPRNVCVEIIGTNERFICPWRGLRRADKDQG